MRLEARLKRRLLEFALLHLFEVVTLPTKVASRLSEALNHFFKPRPRLSLLFLARVVNPRVSSSFPIKKSLLLLFSPI
ncbi:hypothetical protein YC2023_033089 [Brassica napus]